MAESNTAQIAVPAEDGAIGDALEALDAKLTAWMDTVADVQRAFHDQAQRQACAVVERNETSEPVGEAVSAAATLERQDEALVHDLDRLPQGGLSESEAGAAVADAPAQGAAEAVESPAPEADEAAADLADTLVSDLPGMGVPDTTATDEPSTDDQAAARQRAVQEDKELLESLDPKIRMEIRVRRRVDSSKSVQEVLDEILAASPRPEEGHRERKWWKRGGKK